MHVRFILLILPALLLAGDRVTQASADKSPYTGLETRSIKALSEREIAGYRAGRGMGLALAAELNHYPGPRHVLDLADKLQLTLGQRERTRALFEEMRDAAAGLGEQIIQAEARLDDLFSTGRITPIALDKEVQEIARLQGHLRRVHLQTHLAMAKILKSEQIAQYDRLRGYGEGRPQMDHREHGQRKL